MREYILEHQRFLAEIKPAVLAYTPCPRVARQASRLTIAAVMGPAGIGKNTLMDESGMHVATAATSRPWRSSDTNYRRYYNLGTQRDQAVVRRRMEEGRYIQIASHPATGEIYATEREDFRLGVNLMDITAAEYEKIKAQNTFGQVLPIYIVTPTYEQWQTQWRRRGEPSEAEYRSRTQEARAGLVRCLGDASVRFLINARLHESAGLLTHFANEASFAMDEAYQAEARRCAEALVAGIDASGVLKA